MKKEKLTRYVFADHFVKEVKKLTAEEIRELEQAHGECVEKVGFMARIKPEEKENAVYKD